MGDDTSELVDRVFVVAAGNAAPLRYSRPNQAAVHLWYEQCFGRSVAPLRSCEEAIGTWPETATSVGVSLRADDHLRVVAPLGPDDLLTMVLRRNPRRARRELFIDRLRSKRILDRWPAVEVVYE